MRARFRYLYLKYVLPAGPISTSCIIRYVCECVCELHAIGSIILSACLVWGVVASLAVILLMPNSKFKISLHSKMEWLFQLCMQWLYLALFPGLCAAFGCTPGKKNTEGLVSFLTCMKGGRKDYGQSGAKNSKKN